MEEFTRIGMFSSTKINNPSYQMSIPFKTAERNSLKLTNDQLENKTNDGIKSSFEKIKLKFEKKFTKEDENSNTIKKIFQIANFIPTDTTSRLSNACNKNRMSLPNEMKASTRNDAVGEFLNQIEESMTKRFQEKADNDKEIEGIAIITLRR